MSQQAMHVGDAGAARCVLSTTLVCLASFEMSFGGLCFVCVLKGCHLGYVWFVRSKVTEAVGPSGLGLHVGCSWFPCSLSAVAGVWRYSFPLLLSQGEGPRCSRAGRLKWSDAAACGAELLSDAVYARGRFAWGFRALALTCIAWGGLVVGGCFLACLCAVDVRSCEVYPCHSGGHSGEGPD